MPASGMLDEQLFGSTRAGERYPVSPRLDVDGMNDRRFEMLARDVGIVLEQHGYPPVRGLDRRELENLLFGYVYAARGDEGDVEKRLNAGVAAPLRTFTPAGALGSADCVATAHELRRLKGARTVVVVALGDDGVLHMGSAADKSPVIDDVTERLLDAVEAVAAPGAGAMESRVFTVPDREGASS